MMYGAQEFDGPWCILAPPPFISPAPLTHIHTTPYGTTALHIPDAGNGQHSQYWLTAAPPRSLIYTAKELGALCVVEVIPLYATNRMAAPGDLMLPEHILDLTYGEHATFFVNKGYGFIQQNPPYCPKLRNTLLAAARAIIATTSLNERPRIFGRGTCAAIRHPLPPPTTFADQETAQSLSVWGADVVTDGLVPTCFLARELELCYASIGYVVASVAFPPPFNIHTPPPKLQHSQAYKQSRTAQLIQATLINAQQRLTIAIHDKHPDDATDVLLHRERDCVCGQTMRAARERGYVGDDWHTWIA